MNPLALYHQRITDGAIKPDPAQEKVVRVLDELCAALEKRGEGRREKGDIKSFFSSFLPSLSGFCRTNGRAQPVSSLPADAPKGAYIYGPAGRGKSMCMDLFFECAPIAKKRRVHFHAFMQELHRALYLGRQQSSQKMDDALAGFARGIARETSLLCFDEFHVVDVADAMLLGRLFNALWDLGVVTVATSNWAPDDLYKDGLQRDRFLPFIAALKQELTLCNLQSDTDYRLARLRGHQVYYAPLGPFQKTEMENLFAELTDGTDAAPMELQLQGRRWMIRRAAKQVAWLDFTDACSEARGAPDYLALAGAAGVVFLDNLPRLTDDMRNEAKRLMTFIDILYEARTKLVIGAEAAPQELYPAGRHAFEFERTVSRLMEMQSIEYLGSSIGG